MSLSKIFAVAVKEIYDVKLKKRFTQLYLKESVFKCSSTFLILMTQVFWMTRLKSLWPDQENIDKLSPNIRPDLKDVGTMK